MNPVKWLVKALFLFGLLHFSFSLDAITPQHSIKDGDVVISSGKTFALGFFSLSNTTYRYVGIWYYQISEKTVVWVANREDPINDASGTLSISNQGNLVLYQKNQSIPLWSTNASVTHSKNSIARLLDSGNLVLVQNGTALWQSFDYPTNILLPSMKFGLNLSTGFDRFLTAWKSPDDPGIGNYTFKIDPSGFPQLCSYKGSVKFWRGGSWTGKTWVGVPEMTESHIMNVSFVYNNEEISTTYATKNTSVISIAVGKETGLFTRLIWNPEDQLWVTSWSAPMEKCDYYGYCGPNTHCDPTQETECSCLPGFKPKSPPAWYIVDMSLGCARKPNASICQHGEGFVKVARVKIPDTAAANVDMSLGLKQCKDKCLRNCSCMAYASAYFELNGGTGCLTWHGDLVDIKTYKDAGQDFYVRVDAIDLEYAARYRRNGTFSKKHIVAILVVSIIMMLLLVAVSFLLVRRIRTGRKTQPPLSFTSSPIRLEDPLKRNTDLPLFNLATIATATNSLSSNNRLGQGGFGPVYKGTLNGKEIAVKRLSKYSRQGIEEFKNEVTLIAKLQHRNLVRILGCCIEKEEKMLIYEYLPNKSLDSFIFDEQKRSLLDWRRRFEILCGIARGILYLHQDSRLRIIHRDLKASNILLDANMNPKISDFGLAKIFRGDQVEANTKRVVGTYGYMSPEYAMQGQFSIKSDVYSFGVLLLEIITGRRNSGYYPESLTLNLVGHVWELWRNDKAIEIIDSSLGGSCPADEVLRCIQIGLLCVQDSATDRPKMSTIVTMLSNDTSLPSPKQPAFIIKKTTGSGEGISSVNEVTLTVPQPR